MDNAFIELFNRDNASFITSVVIMIVGIVASYVAALPKRWARIIGNILLALAFIVFTHIYYKNVMLSVAIAILSVIWVLICLFLSKNREIISRKKLDRLIRSFTGKTDYQEPLCIFGGDLDFFGDVADTLTWCQQQKWYRNNKIMQRNRQFLQLKDMNFKEIHILGVKPTGKQGKKTRIRIGFLKTQFPDGLTVKFVEEKECAACSENAACLECSVCKDCPENKECGRKSLQKCLKLEKYYQYRCYNPDTKLRGRIAKGKKTGAPTVAIVTTHTPGKSYILKEYSSDTRECTIYQNIWNVWWKKCMEDPGFIESCVAEYNSFVNKE